MPDETNPFSASPIPEQGAHADLHPGSGLGKIAQVPVIGILQIALGSLELLYFLTMLLSLLGAGMSISMGTSSAPANYAVLGLVGGGLLLLLVGASASMRITSGILSFSYRGRTLMLTSLALGLLTSVTCYCAPFSIVVFTYGLIVMLDPQVAQAFRMGADRMPANQIRSILSGH